MSTTEIGQNLHITNHPKECLDLIKSHCNSTVILLENWHTGPWGENRLSITTPIVNGVGYLVEERNDLLLAAQGDCIASYLAEAIPHSTFNIKLLVGDRPKTRPLERPLMVTEIKLQQLLTLINPSQKHHVQKKCWEKISNLLCDVEPSMVLQKACREAPSFYYPRIETTGYTHDNSVSTPG